MQPVFSEMESTSPSAISNLRDTPRAALARALRENDFPAARTLIAKVPPHFSNAFLLTPAVESEDIEMLHTILRLCTDVQTNPDGVASLSAAVRNGRADMLAALIQAGIKANFVHLQYAAGGGDTKSLKVLLEHNSCVEYVHPALNHACGVGNSESIELLLKYIDHNWIEQTDAFPAVGCTTPPGQTLWRA